MDWSVITGECPSDENEFNYYLLNSYRSYLYYGAEQQWVDSEIRMSLTEADIAAVNRALKTA